MWSEYEVVVYGFLTVLVNIESPCFLDRRIGERSGHSYFFTDETVLSEGTGGDGSSSAGLVSGTWVSDGTLCPSLCL